MKPAHRDLWLRPIECVAIGDGRIRLRAPNRYHKEWFEDNFLPSILKDLESRAATRLQSRLRAGRRTGRDTERPRAPGHLRRRSAGWDGNREPAGPSNAARARAPRDRPSWSSATPSTSSSSGRRTSSPTRRHAWWPRRRPSRWNPLFIYGGVGLGKTHLLQAIGHEIHRAAPGVAVCFITCEKFVTDFIGSMMSQKRSSGGSSMEEFRAPLPERARRPPGRRHPVPVQQGQLTGRVLSHLQRAPLRAQADRAGLGQASRGAAGRRRSAPQPLHLGPHRRGGVAGPGDAGGDPQAQGGAREG